MSLVTLLNMTLDSLLNMTLVLCQSCANLCLSQAQLDPLQRLLDDATLLLLQAATLRRRPAIQRPLQAAEESAVLPAERLQPCDHLTRAAEDLLPRQHGIFLSSTLQGGGGK